MTDILLEIAKNPQAKRIVQTLGLPLPIPTPLRRARTPRTETPLADAKVLLASPADTLGVAIADALVRAGANVGLVGEDDAIAKLGDAGEAFGRPVRSANVEGDEKWDALVLDASWLSSPSDLRALWDFFHPVLRRVNKNGRIVVLGRPADETTSVPASAARNALDGFVRSLAKEVGKRGVTANLLVVENGAEERVAGPLRFFLSANSAYVDGQPLRISKKAKASDGAFRRPLEGKKALVTGAARGIGKATATVLASEGAKVYCLDRPDDIDAAAKVAADIGGVALGIDLGGDDAPDLVAKAAEEAGGFDVVVHNAGVTRDRTLAKMKAEYWDLCLNVNLVAVERVTARLVADKLINADGRIICLSSTSGIAGNMGQTNYGAAKAGIIGFARALAPKVARRGITVNVIAPGFIETRLTDAMPVGIREVARRLNSLGQGGRPVDVAEAITFLATPNASGVTGQVLRVCGQALVGA